MTRVPWRKCCVGSVLQHRHLCERHQVHWFQQLAQDLPGCQCSDVWPRHRVRHVRDAHWYVAVLGEGCVLATCEVWHLLGCVVFVAVVWIQDLPRRAQKVLLVQRIDAIGMPEFVAASQYRSPPRSMEVTRRSAVPCPCRPRLLSQLPGLPVLLPAGLCAVWSLQVQSHKAATTGATPCCP